MRGTIVSLAGVCVLAAVVGLGCATTTAKKGASDADNIMSLLDSWKTALIAKDLDHVMPAYSENYQGRQGSGKAGVKKYLEGAIGSGYLDGAAIDLSNMKMEVHEDKATVAPVVMSGPKGTIRLRVDLVKEKGKWFIAGMNAA